MASSLRRRFSGARRRGGGQGVGGARSRLIQPGARSFLPGGLVSAAPAPGAWGWSTCSPPRGTLPAAAADTGSATPARKIGGGEGTG